MLFLSSYRIPNSIQSALYAGVFFVFNSTMVWADSGVSQTPFSDPKSFQEMANSLPTLGYQDDSETLNRKLAGMFKSIGEASQKSSNENGVKQQTKVWAFNHFRDAVATRIKNTGESLLSPYGMAQMDLNVNMRGNFNGSGGALLTPWADHNCYLTFSQMSLHQTNNGLVGNIGLGQRWMAGSWLLGYNAFLDRQIDDGLQRFSLGTEAWGDFLRFSANYYAPLSDWQESTSSRQQRMARGYDITTRGYLPFYRQLGASFTWEQYLGDNVTLFNNDTGYHNPAAIKVGVLYTPVPLITFSAARKTGSGGESQDQFGVKFNYRFGVALDRQLSANNVDEALSLRGSRYDMVTRSNTPVLDFRPRKTFSVFLATPPWRLNPGESLALKLQIHAANPITRISWQGDTQALSLTSPVNNTDPHGWSIILPPWDDTPGASNSYHLAVTLEDSKQQRVTSNWITLTLQSPLIY